MSDTTQQRRAERLVSKEVLCCLSSLVTTLAGGSYRFDADAGLRDLFDQAGELAAPLPDYESAAREAGADCHKAAGRDEWRCWSIVGEDGDTTDWQPSEAEAWRVWCENADVEPHDREVYEHWAVTGWLADRLEAKGERVDRDFAGLTVWARTTTGQAISIDEVIEAITAETGYAGEG